MPQSTSDSPMVNFKANAISPTIGFPLYGWSWKLDDAFGPPYSPTASTNETEASYQYNRMLRRWNSDLQYA